MDEQLTFEFCRRIFEKNEVNLSREQFEKLQKYADLLIAESARQNVTAVRTRAEIWVRHFLDSAYLLRFLNDSSDVLDMGTGGGIPAIPLAIMNPTLRITMLDSELRKIEFCENAIAALDLTANAICGRAEELAQDETYRGQFDFVVSRAMAAGSMLSELSVPFLRVGGSLLAMKGRQYDPEFERFSYAAEKLLCSVDAPIPYSIESEQKYLILVRKLDDTPSQYPRRFAKIKRNPL